MLNSNKQIFIQKICAGNFVKFVLMPVLLIAFNSQSAIAVIESKAALGRLNGASTETPVDAATIASAGANTGASTVATAVASADASTVESKGAATNDFASSSDFLNSIPNLSSPVVDQVGLISKENKYRIISVIEKVYEKKAGQIQVLIIESLQGNSIEEYSIKVVEKWKLGTEKKDNGVLLLVALKDKKIRIEVGQGLEGAIPDIYAKRIIREVISPAFKARQYGEGIYQGVLQMAVLSLKEAGFDPNTVLGADLAGAGRGNSDNGNAANKGEDEFGKNGELKIPWRLIVFLVLFIMFFGGGFGGPRFRRRSGLGGFGGGFGGGGFGSGSGGGWSGGGGGFSGGGASGDW